MPSATPVERNRPVRAALFLLLVLAAHVTLGVVLYRGRAISNWGYNDLVVFCLPFVLAVWGYYLALGPLQRFDGHRARRLRAAFFSSMGSFLIVMLWNVNHYGE